MRSLHRVVLAISFCACAPKPPCIPSQPPARGRAMNVFVTFDFTYWPEDTDSALRTGRAFVVDKLNQLGRTDSNSFVMNQPGELTLDFWINDPGGFGHDLFTGYVNLSGAGHVFVHRFNRDAPHTSLDALVAELTADAYVYIHNGYSDRRPACGKH
jgi:hypothetical protein